MATTVETVIIGGGVIGTSCLYHLTQQGHGDVLLLERDALASGSTGASVAIVETQYLDPNQVALTAYGKRMCDDFEHRLGLPFVHHGYLRLGRTEPDLERFRQSLELQARFGISGASVIDVGGIEDIVPELVTDDGIIGALWGPDDGYIDAVRYCEIFVSLAKERGAKTLASRRVTEVLLGERGVEGVRCGTEEIRCGRIINAAGAWGREVGRMIGQTFPVDGYRRQVGDFTPPAPFERPVPFIIDYVPGMQHEGLYFRDDTPNRLIAGLHWENYADWETPEDPDRCPTDLEWEYGTRLATSLAERWRGGSDFALTGGWSGLYPLTPDGGFILGEVASVPGFFNALGGGGVGVQTAAGIGLVLADLITKGETTLLPEPDAFRLERFEQLAASPAAEGEGEAHGQA